MMWAGGGVAHALTLEIHVVVQIVGVLLTVRLEGGQEVGDRASLGPRGVSLAPS